jgi:hypothetical protein
MVALVPVLSDLDARKSDRRLERDQAKRLGNAVGQIRRQRRNAVGLRRYNCAGDEARHPQQNIRWRDICRENALGCAMRGMAGFRCRDQNMARDREL